MGDKLLCLKSDCPDRWESVSEHFVLMKLRAEAHKLREERDALLAALEAAPKWPDGNLPWFMLAGRYRDWYNGQRQAAIAAVEGK